MHRKSKCCRLIVYTVKDIIVYILHSRIYPKIQIKRLDSLEKKELHQEANNFAADISRRTFNYKFCG